MPNRCELILVTGFLGAGKTTVLQRLLSLYAGYRVHLIVNEFGKIGVDGALLKDLGATMKEIVNGSIFCACRLDQFETALDEVQKLKPEYLIVETSGLSDPTAIRALLEQGSRYPDIHYKGCMALADAARLHKVIDTARVCHKQLSIADLILLTKTDIASHQQTQEARSLLALRYPGIPVVQAVQGEISRELVETLSTSHAPLSETPARDLALQKHCLAVSPVMTPDELRGFLRLIVEDTHRIKGFVRLNEETYLVDCVGSYISISLYADCQADNRLVVLSAEGLPLRKSLKEALAWYSGQIEEVK